MMTIVTPCFNGERFLDTCIRNVVEQNCADLEHVIIDGGSTDRTVEMLKAYTVRYSHIRWVSEPDSGQSDAMNKGMRMAQGEILGYLNVDDYYEPGVLKRVERMFDGIPKPALLVGNCKVIGDEGEVRSLNKPKRLNVVDLLSGRGTFPLNPSAYFYHKSLHQIIGDYVVDEHYMMDFDFLLKAFQAAHVKYVDEIWGNHLHIEGTKTVELMQSGEHRSHLLRLLESHRRKLSLRQRWQISLVSSMRKNIGRYRFYIRNPSEFFSMLRKRRISPDM